MKTKLTAAVTFGLLLLTPATTFAQSASSVGYGQATTGRTWATVAAVIGLVSAIIAGLALFRSVKRIGNRGRYGAIIAAVVGFVVTAYAIVHLIMFNGDFGTGNGRAGALLAIVFGILSMILAGTTLGRSRRTK